MHNKTPPHRPVLLASSPFKIARFYRHTGTFSEQSSVGQTKNKEVARKAAVMTFLKNRDIAFDKFRGIHENFHLANVASYKPLRSKDFVVVLRQSKKSEKQEVLLGEVITMYTKSDAKNARHEWIPSVDNIGLLSNIYIRVFSPFAGTSMFTSMSCPSLSSSTILQVPRSHVLFSFASTSTTVQQLKTPDGHPFSVISLDQHSETVFGALRSSCASLYVALKALTGRSPKGSAKNTVNLLVEADLSDSEGPDDDGMEEEQNND